MAKQWDHLWASRWCTGSSSTLWSHRAFLSSPRRLSRLTQLTCLQCPFLFSRLVIPMPSLTRCPSTRTQLICFRVWLSGTAHRFSVGWRATVGRSTLSLLLQSLLLWVESRPRSQELVYLTDTPRGWNFYDLSRVKVKFSLCIWGSACTHFVTRLSGSKSHLCHWLLSVLGQVT